MGVYQAGNDGTCCTELGPRDADNTCLGQAEVPGRSDVSLLAAEM